MALISGTRRGAFRSGRYAIFSTRSAMGVATATATRIATTIVIMAVTGPWFRNPSLSEAVTTK